MHVYLHLRGSVHPVKMEFPEMRSDGYIAYRDFKMCTRSPLDYEEISKEEYKDTFWKAYSFNDYYSWIL